MLFRKGVHRQVEVILSDKHIITMLNLYIAQLDRIKFEKEFWLRVEMRLLK